MGVVGVRYELRASLLAEVSDSWPGYASEGPLYVDESKVKDSVYKYSALAEDSDSCRRYVFKGPLYVYESKVEDSVCKQAALAEDLELLIGTLKSDAKVNRAVYACPAPLYVVEDWGEHPESRLEAGGSWALLREANQLGYVIRSVRVGSAFVDLAFSFAAVINVSRCS